jgi:DNA-binding NarL/FixJ family response regulator
VFACDDGPCRVIIADDVDDIRQMVRFWLDSIADEFEVVGEAADGIEAIAAADAHQPHAIILDLSMPKMDGLTAIAEIRRRSPSSKILVMSGFDSAVMSARAIQLGADAYVEKGTGFGELTSVLRRLCDQAA